MGCSVLVNCQDDVDPLKKNVHLKFGEAVGKGNYQPIQQMVHTFARMNDCVVQRIRRFDRDHLVLEVLVKTRHSPVMDKNPLKTGDKSGTTPED